MQISTIVTFLSICLAILVLSPPDASGQEVEALSLDSLLNLNVSTASKYDQTMEEAPASVTIVTAEQINRYGYTTIAEVLGSVRGFYLANDHQRTYVGTRGFNRMLDQNNRILLLLNGHTLNEGTYGSASLDKDFGLDLDMVERIEVVRGPGSVLYGTGAMFAVVNIITKTAPSNEGLIVHGDGGSHGYMRSTLTYAHAFSELKVFATGALTDIAGQDLYFKEFDSPSTNNGIAENRDWSNYQGGMVRALYSGWSLQGLFSHSDHGIPTGDFGSIFNNGASSLKSTRLSVELKREKTLSPNTHLALRSYFDYATSGLIFPMIFDVSGFPLQARYNILTKNKLVGGESIFRWDLRSDDRLIAGMQFIRNFDADITSRALLPAGMDIMSLFQGDFPYTIFSAYAENEYQIDPNLSLTLGLRQDWYSRAGSATTPRAAVVFHPFTRTALKLLYGEAFRAPNTFEVNFSGPIERLKPNPDLNPERIQTAEFDWEQRFNKHWTSTLSVFDYDLSNLIQGELDTSDMMRQFMNIERVHTRGAEIEIQRQSRDALNGYASYSYQHARQFNPNQALVNSPQHILKAGLFYSAFHPVILAGELRIESRRRTNLGARTPAYALFNFNLSTQPVFQHVRVAVHLYNVMDAHYSVPSGAQHVQDSFIQEGRSVKVELSLKI